MSIQTNWLIQLDVDSTFIQQEAIELLAAQAGVLPEVAAITDRAMRGELDFQDSLIARVKLLTGLPESSIALVQEQILLTDGSEKLVQDAHARGHMVALVSGGFRQIMQPIVKGLEIDFFCANELEVEAGFLTGNLIGPIIDRAAKAQALRDFCERSGIPLTNTIAIGDGANDLDMMALAAISIAFNAKPIVASASDFQINEPSLRSVLDLAGLR